MAKKRIPPFDDPNEPAPGVIPGVGVNIVDYVGSDLVARATAMRIKAEVEEKLRERAKS
jgi:hypothetical protein